MTQNATITLSEIQRFKERFLEVLAVDSSNVEALEGIGEFTISLAYRDKIPPNVWLPSPISAKDSLFIVYLLQQALRYVARGRLDQALLLAAAIDDAQRDIPGLEEFSKEINEELLKSRA